MSFCSPSFTASHVCNFWDDIATTNPTSPRGHILALQFQFRLIGPKQNPNADHSTNNPLKLVAFHSQRHYSPLNSHGLRLRRVGPESVAKAITGSEEGQNDSLREEVRDLIDGGGGGGEGGGDSFGNGGGGGGGGGDEEEEREFGPILKFEEVMKETEARGVELPLDMMEAAKTTGIRQLLLERYLDLQVRMRLGAESLGILLFF